MAKIDRTPELHNHLSDSLPSDITFMFTEDRERDVISVIANYANGANAETVVNMLNVETQVRVEEARVRNSPLRKDSDTIVDQSGPRADDSKRIHSEEELSPRKKIRKDSNEKQTFQKEEGGKASRAFRRQLEAGKAFAPCNTTEFIMEEHDHLVDSKLLDDIRVLKPRSGYQPDSQRSEDYYMPQLNEEEYLQREFSNDYEKTEYDILSNMAHWELVNENIMLEDEIAELENRLHLPVNYSLNYESPDEFSETEGFSLYRATEEHPSEPAESDLDNSECAESGKDDARGSYSKQIDESRTSLFEPIYDETAEKIRITNEEIQKLSEENEMLQNMIERDESENVPTCLCMNYNSDSESGTEDSDSDSSSSSSASSTADSSTDSSSSESDQELTRKTGETV